MNSLTLNHLISDFCRAKLIDESYFIKNFHQCYQHLVNYIIKQAETKTNRRPFIVGLSAPQGAGKSTLVTLIKLVVEQYFNQRVAVLSLDDFYLTLQQRQSLAKNIHPLLATRGVPGTHDINLALNTLTALTTLNDHTTIKLPRFNKSNDDRYPEEHWTLVEKPVDLILLEGWCLNAKPQTKKALLSPINKLEQQLDQNGVWRDYVNQQLAGDYPKLFALIDLSITFYPPSFEVVCDWRRQQEAKLINSLLIANKPLDATMNESELSQFMMHFERITRHHFIDNQSQLISKHLSNNGEIMLSLDSARNPRFISQQPLLSLGKSTFVEYE